MILLIVNPKASNAIQQRRIGFYKFFVPNSDDFNGEKMMRPRIAFLGPTDGYEAARAALDNRADLVLVDPSSLQKPDYLAGFGALIDASMQAELSRSVFAKANEMRIVACASTGTDHVDREALKQMGIKFWCLRDDPKFLADINAAAEATWALALALVRRVTWASSSVLDGNWNRDLFPGVLLRGRTLGVLGLGRLGSWIARYGTAFDMRVLSHDLDPNKSIPGVERVSIEELFVESDLLSIHVPFSEQTRLLVSQRLIGMMKPGKSFLINSSRGGILDEDALLKALENGHLAGAALDVLQGEPEIANHPLVQYANRHQNLLITPHFAGLTDDSLGRVCARAAVEVRSTLGAEPR